MPANIIDTPYVSLESQVTTKKRTWSRSSVILFAAVAGVVGVCAVVGVAKAVQAADDKSIPTSSQSVQQHSTKMKLRSAVDTANQTFAEYRKSHHIKPFRLTDHHDEAMALCGAHTEDGRELILCKHWGKTAFAKHENNTLAFCKKLMRQKMSSSKVHIHENMLLPLYHKRACNQYAQKAAHVHYRKRRQIFNISVTTTVQAVVDSAREALTSDQQQVTLTKQRVKHKAQKRHHGNTATHRNLQSLEIISGSSDWIETCSLACGNVGCVECSPDSCCCPAGMASSSSSPYCTSSSSSADDDGATDDGSSSSTDDDGATDDGSSSSSSTDDDTSSSDSVCGSAITDDDTTNVKQANKELQMVCNSVSSKLQSAAKTEICNQISGASSEIESLCEDVNDPKSFLKDMLQDKVLKCDDCIDNIMEGVYCANAIAKGDLDDDGKSSCVSLVQRAISKSQETEDAAEDAGEDTAESSGSGAEDESESSGDGDDNDESSGDGDEDAGEDAAEDAGEDAAEDAGEDAAEDAVGDVLGDALMCLCL